MYDLRLAPDEDNIHICCSNGRTQLLGQQLLIALAAFPPQTALLGDADMRAAVTVLSSNAGSDVAPDSLAEGAADGLCRLAGAFLTFKY